MTQLSIACFLIIVGVLVYYGVPLSFLNVNYLTAFLILGSVLIMVIIGMTFLCSIIYSYGERLFLWIILHTCCRRDKRLHSLILTTMDGHQIRNQKTSIIYTLSIAFLLFACSYFILLATLIDKAISKSFGADINVYAW